MLALLALVLANGAFVTVEKDAGGVWWFKHGDASFLSRGVNHVNNGGQDDGVGGRESAQCKAATGHDLCGDSLSFGRNLTYSPYFNSTMDRYGGSEAAWANNTAERLAQWGFNTVGGWSCTLAERAGAARGLYYAHLLDMGTTWLNHAGLDHDPWTEAFAAQCEAVARVEVAARASDELLLGYQIDNELNWTSLGLPVYLAKGASPGQQQAEGFLASEFNGSIAALNVAWNIEASGFDDVVRHLNDAGLNKTAFGDANAGWYGLIAAQYYRVTVGAIKKYDAHHLILGMRGMNVGFWRLSRTHTPSGGQGILDYPAVLRAMAPYVDVFDWHSYEDDPQTAMLAQVHALTGRPVLLGEFSFIAWDSNVANTHGARSCGWHGHTLPRPNGTDVGPGEYNGTCAYVSATQGGRAAGFSRFVAALAAAPFVVGYHWWQWADEPTGGRWPDGECSNYGVVHLDDDAYGVLTGAMKEANARVEASHAASAQAPK